MRVLRVVMGAPVASFRRPLDHNYQRTLPLPPPTTLLGIAGAALGLSDRQLWADDSPLRGARVAVWANTEPGRARDMWTVLKIKANKIAERSPYFRELLFFVSYTIVYSLPDPLLERLQAAFLDPVYPPSLGREDELALVEDVALREVTPGQPQFRGTVLPGDIRKDLPRPVLQPGVRAEPLTVETLPLFFQVDSKGVRSPQQMMPLSFVPVQLEIELPSPSFPVFQLDGRNFTWANFSPSPTSPS